LVPWCTSSSTSVKAFPPAPIQTNLLQEQIENLMRWIQEPNRDGAPGIDNTKRSLADLQGGGRKD
jgi:hypothetical protein